MARNNSNNSSNTIHLAIFLAVTGLLISAAEANVKMGAYPKLGPSGKPIGGYTFHLWAPHASKVSVELRRDAESLEPIALQRGDENVWYGEGEGVKAGDDYRIALESSHNDCFGEEGAILYRRDPYSRFSAVEAFEEAWCKVTDCGLNFEWSQKEHPWLLKDGMYSQSIYEMHIGTFSKNHSFASATEQLDHVASMGFTCVELMPVVEYGGAWGYNPRLCMSIHSPYGTPDDLRRFIDRAHNLGIAIKIDLVLNHGSSRLNCLWNYDGSSSNGQGGIYFDEGGGDTPWGRKFAFNRPEVQEYLTEACRIFFDEYRVDGIRFDSAHNVPDWLNSNICQMMAKHYPKSCNSAEVVPEDPKFLLGGVGFHAVWLHAPVFDLIDFTRGCGEEWGAKFRSMIRQRWFPDKAASTGVNGLLGTHDQVGCRKNGGHNDDGRLRRYFCDRVGGRQEWNARAKTRMWWSANAVGIASGVPMMFQGTEILQPGWWHTDQPFRWDLAPANGLGSDGGSEEAIEMMKTVKETLRIRKEHPALCGQDPQVVHVDEKNYVWGVRRGEYLSVINVGSAQFGDKDDDRYGVSCGDGAKAVQIFNSQAKELGGWDGSWTVKGQETVSCSGGKLMVKLPKYSVTVYRFV